MFLTVVLSWSGSHLKLLPVCTRALVAVASKK